MNMNVTSPVDFSGLIQHGFRVKPSSTKAGKFRWFRDTGGDGVSVPPVECSHGAFETSELAWSDAVGYAKRCGLTN